MISIDGGGLEMLHHVDRMLINIIYINILYILIIHNIFIHKFKL